MATAVPVGSLTDAELAVLARPRSRVGPRPVMPLWSRLDRDQRASAVHDARAALVARRLIDADADARSRGQLRRELRSVVVLRETATRVVAVARSTARGRDHWYAHVTGGVVLLEQVSGDGVHRFALTAAVTLPTLVAAAVLHPEAAVASAASPDDETDWLRADVELRGADRRPRRRAWVSGPGGTWRVVPGAAVAVEPAEVLGEVVTALAAREDADGC